MNALPEAQIKPDRVKSVLAGHPWIFSGALAQVPKVPAGSLVRAVCGKQFLGIGYYNPKTDIAIRLLSLRDVPIDAGFFAETKLMGEGGHGIDAHALADGIEIHVAGMDQRFSNVD